MEKQRRDSNLRAGTGWEQLDTWDKRKKVIPEPGESGSGESHLPGAAAFCRGTQLANLGQCNSAGVWGVNTPTNLSTPPKFLLVFAID